MKKLILITILTSLYLPINAQSWWKSEKIKGNGNIIKETKAIEPFKKLNIGGSFDVFLIAGKQGTLTIEGEQNIITLIETKVKKGVLSVNFKENTNIITTKKLTVTIPFEEINSINLGGSGAIHVKKIIESQDISFNIGGSGDIIATINTNNIETAIGGSGNIKLTGKTNNLSCSIAGSGNIESYDLQTKNLKGAIAGSGSVKATVEKTIKASIVGSGNIYYKGNPSKIKSNSIGSGDVINKN